MKFLRQYDVKRWDGQTKRTICDDTQAIENGRLRYQHAYWITRSTSTDERRYFTTPGLLINNTVNLSSYSTMTIKFQLGSNPYVSSRFRMYWYSTKPTVQWGYSTWGSIDPGGVSCSSPGNTSYSSSGTYTATFTDLSSKYTRTGGWWVLVLPYQCNSEGMWAGSVSTWLDYLWSW